MEWNHDMSAAPRGRFETRQQKGPKGQVIEREVFVPAKVILAGKTKGHVTVSHWMPETDKRPGRWEMFATNEEPIAWMQWPEYPEETRE